MKNLDDTRVRGYRRLGAKAANGERSRGQILILFVMAIFVFVGMVALVIDVSWYWVNSLRVQRAADAAALAGVVQLPTNPTAVPGGAFALAVAEAKKNGYDPLNVLTPGITVTTTQDPAVTGRRLIVKIDAPVPTFFMRIFGINSIVASRTSKAEFVLPVPMGSPEAWYGVFGPVREAREYTSDPVAAYTTDDGPRSSGFKVATAAPAPTTPVWTRTPTTGFTLITAVNTEDTAYARTNTNGATQDWGTFDIVTALPPANETATIVTGLQVELTDVHLSAACAGTTNTIRVSLSYDAGAHWSVNSAAQLTPNLGTSVTAGDYSFGSTTSTAPWSTFTPAVVPAHVWTGNDLGNSNFRLRLTANKACGTSGTQLNVDRIRVQATYRYDTFHPFVPATYSASTSLPLGRPGTPCAGVAACYRPDGTVLTARGFWGTMNQQGSESINGDAYQPIYDDNTAPLKNNSSYDPDNYYNYAVEMPAGSTGGSVYVFDPVFCATQLEKGTADRWFSGTGNPMSSFFELYDTKGTLYDPGDDGAPVASSNGLFRDIDGYDTLMQANPTSPAPYAPATLPGTTSECAHSTVSTYGDGRDYHNNWYLLASGLTGGTNGKVYRVHTTTTDPASASAQLGRNGENSFAIYASASAAPRIYGIGAMQAFTPLKATGSPVISEFYLAQIEAVHAGKTVEIKLWDPGDTQDLSASLQILVPTPGGWTPTLFDYTAAQGTTKTGTGGPEPCNALAGSATSVQTNAGTGAPGFFNGCWLTIQIPIPGNYAADQSGWWKIRYTMDGDDVSSDVTTWKVGIRGNPVHLIVP